MTEMNFHLLVMRTKSSRAPRRGRRCNRHLANMPSLLLRNQLPEVFIFSIHYSWSWWYLYTEKPWRLGRFWKCRVPPLRGIAQWKPMMSFYIFVQSKISLFLCIQFLWYSHTRTQKGQTWIAKIIIAESLSNQARPNQIKSIQPKPSQTKQNQNSPN